MYLISKVHNKTNFMINNKDHYNEGTKKKYKITRKYINYIVNIVFVII
jgi:hypothetical protein